MEGFTRGISGVLSAADEPATVWLGVAFSSMISTDSNDEVDIKDANLASSSKGELTIKSDSSMISFGAAAFRGRPLVRAEEGEGTEVDEAGMAATFGSDDDDEPV